MKNFFLYLLLITSIYSFSQNQLGNNINGVSGGDESGTSVSLSSDGSIIAIGSPLNDFIGSNAGLVRVYEFNNNTLSWEQLGNDIYGAAADDEFGHCVSLSNTGSIFAIGAPYNDGNGIDSGHVRIYTYNTNTDTWNQLGGDIEGALNTGMAINGDRLGYAVSLSSDGSIVAISSPFYQLDKGRVHMYSYNTNTNVWELIGLEIIGISGSRFGFSLSLSSDGGTVAVGLPTRFVNGSPTGAVEIYNYNTNTDLWEQQGSTILGESSGDDSGYSVSLSSDGSIVAVGAPFNNGSGPSSGHVRVHAYNTNSGNWEQLGNDIDGEASPEPDDSGISVSLSGDGYIVIVGARGSNGTSGKARVYRYNNTTELWEQLGMDIEGESGATFGTSVNIISDASIVAISGPYVDSNGPNSGYVGVYSFEEILSTNTISFQEANLYPNPAKDQFIIQLKEGIQFKKASIYNQLGQFISSTTSKSMNVESLSQGIYFVEITTDKGRSTKKLIID